MGASLGNDIIEDDGSVQGLVYRIGILAKWPSPIRKHRMIAVELSGSPIDCCAAVAVCPSDAMPRYVTGKVSRNFTPDFPAGPADL